MFIRCASIASLVACLSWQTVAAFTNEVASPTGGGGMSANASLHSIGAVGVWASADGSASGSHWQRAGLLASLLLHPFLDCDGDGIPDEDDGDDDNDALSDVDELMGVGFSPATPTDPFASDTDGDGASDGREATAGTNPDDADSHFSITEVREQGDALVITWQGREGVSYDLAASAALNPDFFQVITNVVATGGTGVWFQAEVSATLVPSEAHLFYRVKIHE